MSSYNLGFIRDDDLLLHVKQTIEQYRFAIDLTGFNKNLIDPIKLTFDAKVYNKSIEAVIDAEISRQIDKSNNNTIGYFHQNLFHYIGKDWVVPKEGYDIVNHAQSIFVEMKNKHNTMNASSSQKTYIRMQSTIHQLPEATCLLVEVIAKASQDKPWSISLDKQSIVHPRIRRMSIDRFYALVTGRQDAFKALCEALPRVIDDALQSVVLNQASNTVFDALRRKSPNVLKSLYLLAFEHYDGFSNLSMK